jgi:hypothetical protein
MKVLHSSQARLALVLGGVVVLFYLLSTYSSGKGAIGEGMEEKIAGALGIQGPLATGLPQSTNAQSVGGNAQPVESVQGRHPSSHATYSETKLGPEELLPKGGLGASWAAVNPAAMGDLKGQNFLEAGYHTNTAIAGVSQTNRNASWDIRSEQPNPQVKVGPFLNSTIEANPFKRGLDA